MLPLLLTVKQAAELMGVGRTTLYELMDTGEVYSVHRGASRRLPLWAVYDYVDRLCDGQFRRVPLPAVVDLLVRLSDERDGGDEIGSRRHRALLESEHDDRVDGGAVAAINAQRNASNGRQIEPPARPVA